MMDYPCAIASLVIVVSAVLVLTGGQTITHTQTRMIAILTRATPVGVSKYCFWSISISTLSISNNRLWRQNILCFRSA